MEQQSYLTDLEFNPVFASTGKRFLNYLIDLIVFLIFWYVLLIVFISAGGRINSYPPYSDILFRIIILIFYAF